MTPLPAAPPATLYDKLWTAHVVSQAPGHPGVVYVDLHLVHDGTFRRAFEMLDERGLTVAHPERAIATTDHCLPTRSSFTGAATAAGGIPLQMVTGLVAACTKHGIRVFGPDHDDQGIVHVIGPELGLVHPGMTVICADSHTTTLGALGALAFAVGTTQVLHALATQCVLQQRARTLRIEIDGALRPGVSAKDLILALLARHGIDAAAGCAVEFAGSTVRAMGIDERLTLCNMAAELGARAALVAPDDTTFAYLAGRRFAPKDAAWDEAVRRWRSLRSDDGARFDVSLEFDASTVEPMVTFGTTPAMGIAVSGTIPQPHLDADAGRRKALGIALEYMALEPGRPLAGHPVDVVFIGSCTNSRIDDLRAAAFILRQGKVATGVRLLVVAGSHAVRRQAEAEGLDRIVIDAGGEWGHPGCSLCVAMNDEAVAPGQYVASTSNRNFQGRQGPGARTFLMSPLTAAATALQGRVADPRPYIAHAAARTQA